MSFRDFVSGADNCAPGDGAGPSNAAAALADTLLGGRSKQQQQLQELPGFGQAGPSGTSFSVPFQPYTAAQAAEAALHADLPAIPGLAGPSSAHFADVDAFLRSQARTAGPVSPQDHLVQEFESIYGGLRPSVPAQLPAGVAARGASANAHNGTLLMPSLQAFFHGAGAMPLPPGLELSVPDKCRVRDRSTILARHVFAHRGNVYADQQVDRLLHSLNIDPAALPSAPAADAAAWERIYRGGGSASLAAARPSSIAAEHAAGLAGHALSSGMHHTHARSQPWVDQFTAMHLNNKERSAAAAAWAADFEAQHQPQQPGAWAEEFAASSSMKADVANGRQRAADTTTAMEQTRRLADTLSASPDPKMQQSKFLQFVSKMSRGELIVEDNAVKEVTPTAAAWAEEFDTIHAAAAAPGGRDRGRWAEEFAAAQASLGGAADTEAAEGWVEDFAERMAGRGDEWASQFEETRMGINASQDVAAKWEEEYLQELEQLHGVHGPGASAGYVMTKDNPFLTDTASFEKGKDLFRRGVLSEAILALEAECQRSPSNAEAWRLLGTVQAEADDDVQAIAALNRAVATDPENLDALLSLGVSYTNELEQSSAVRYLSEWLSRHPSHEAVARAASPPPDASQAVSSTVRAFEAAAAAAPRDADVHAALGVLYNVARRYDDAVAAFRAALALRSQDYSLWNKLGATLANSGRSSEAISAYQKALDLKPNYMRAWTNMGISYANLGDYEGSAWNYVRALALNRNAAAVWGYLRTSLACADRSDLALAADKEDLEALMAAMPHGAAA